MHIMPSSILDRLEVPAIEAIGFNVDVILENMV